MRQSRPGVDLKGAPPRREKERGIGGSLAGEGRRACRRMESSDVLGWEGERTVPVGESRVMVGRVLVRSAEGEESGYPRTVK